MSGTFMSGTFMPEIFMLVTFEQIIFYFYIATIIAALLSYIPQEVILINMIRGRRPVSMDISAAQYWVWCGAYAVATSYAVFIVKTDIPLIISACINLFHTTLTSMLNSYVHYLYRRKHT